MKLIDNWKKAWRMASVQVAAGAIAFGALPETVQAAMLGSVGLPVTAVPVPRRTLNSPPAMVTVCCSE